MLTDLRDTTVKGMFGEWMSEINKYRLIVTGPLCLCLFTDLVVFKLGSGFLKIQLSTAYLLFQKISSCRGLGICARCLRTGCTEICVRSYLQNYDNIYFAFH